MNEPTKVEKVIGKINGLRKIAGSTHSKAEKETCLKLAANLIAQFQLDEAALIEQDKSNDPGIDLDSESIIYESGRITPWKSELSIALASLNGLFIYNAWVRNPETHRKCTRYRIIGRQADITIALYMMGYLVDTIEELAADYVPGGKKRGVNPERESWCLGCVRGFVDKMKAERDAVNQTATGTALVFIGNKVREAEQAFKEKTGIKLTHNNYQSKAQHHGDTYSSGYQRGQKLTVNKGLND